jgi:hypothetical protein
MYFDAIPVRKSIFELKKAPLSALVVAGFMKYPGQGRAPKISKSCVL